jgi:hypothetical protein
LEKIYYSIPDASKLRAEEDCFGMLKEQKMVKVTFWIDELKFEKLGTIAQPGHLFQMAR